MIGAILGDIIGAKYEFNNIKTTDFDIFDKENTNFTDDTVMTLAIAQWLLSKNLSKNNLEEIMVSIAEKYRNAGYGGLFYRWLFQYESFAINGKRATCRMPYNSFGNGAAMRVSPIGYAFNSLKETLEYAKISAEITHNHPEGIKGAQAVASTIFLARTSVNKQDIKKYVEENFGYNLSRSCDEIRPTYEFNETCQGTVPEAITAFLESTDFENAIRLAVSLGGDSDTLTSITGAISEAYYRKISDDFIDFYKEFLDDFQLKIVNDFYREFI